MEFTLLKQERSLNNDEMAKVHNAVHNLLMKSNVGKCFGCLLDFNTRDLKVHMYDHDGGWNVGLEKKQWLSILHEDCGYHTSFSKLGIKEKS